MLPPPAAAVQLLRLQQKVPIPVTTCHSCELNQRLHFQKRSHRGPEAGFVFWRKPATCIFFSENRNPKKKVKPAKWPKLNQHFLTCDHKMSKTKAKKLNHPFTPTLTLLTVEKGVQSEGFQTLSFRHQRRWPRTALSQTKNVTFKAFCQFH